MYYLDTNVIIAYGFREEVHHKIAKKAVNNPVSYTHLTLPTTERV